MSYEWYDILGNIGVILILLCYLLLQIEKLSAGGIMFSSLNAIGAAFILISLLYQFNLSAFLIEFFWLMISLFALARQFYYSIKSKKLKPAESTQFDK